MAEFKRHKPKPIAYYVRLVNFLGLLLGVVADNPKKYTTLEKKRRAYKRIAYSATILALLLFRLSYLVSKYNNYCCVTLIYIN